MLVIILSVGILVGLAVGAIHEKRYGPGDWYNPFDWIPESVVVGVMAGLITASVITIAISSQTLYQYYN